MVNTVYGRNSSSSSSDGASVSTRSSQREDDEVEDQGPSSPQCMRVTDLTCTGLGSGYRSSGAPSAFVAAIQKQAPSMEGDKQGRILANGPKFEHYMDMIPLLARQFDDLPGGDPTGGTCLAQVLRFSQQNPRISADRVPDMQRAQQSAANKALFQILLGGLTEVWREIAVDLRH